jgi:hypothetical protein
MYRIHDMKLHIGQTRLLDHEVGNGVDRDLRVIIQGKEWASHSVHHQIPQGCNFDGWKILDAESAKCGASSIGF